MEETVDTNGKRVAILFCRKDSVYKKNPIADVFDANRDARTYKGPWPVVAHPPCRAWGSLRMFAKPKKGERSLAIFAIRQVRKYGGVLEHPAASRLWTRCGLPRPGGAPDHYGGWSIGITQHWFGHRATKKTLLYIFGVDPKNIPLIPLVLGSGTHVIKRDNRSNRKKLPLVTKAEREHTPPALADWLIDLALRCTGR